MRETGLYTTIGNIRYFIPHPLPPAHPPLALTDDIITLYGQASFALGVLNAIGQQLPG